MTPKQLKAATSPGIEKWAPGVDGAISGLSVDTSVRGDVVAFYHCIYLASEDFDNYHGWTGSLTGCNAGTLSQRVHDDTRRRINYYRAMAGLNADITFDSTWNAKAQQASLMMARNESLSHTPPAGWACYTSDGYDGANASNLSIGFNSARYGPNAVDGQMEDAGNNNTPVGHRRWLIYSRSQKMGNGGIPLTQAVIQSNFDVSAGSVWVIGDFAPSAPAGVQFIAWPPEGYVPHQVVWPRWSFGVPNSGAGFGSASVTMRHAATGATIPVTIIHRGSAGIGDPTIVWEPTVGTYYPGYPETAPTADTAFEITVSGISGNSPSSFTYTVNVMNPNDGGNIPITGPAAPPANMASTYAFTPLAGATGYEVRSAEVQTGTVNEGAETATNITDQSSASYALRTTGRRRSGTYSFHLAFPSPDTSDQSFTINKVLIPSATSNLVFYNFRTFQTNGMYASAEVSSDGGGSWTILWDRGGQGIFNSNEFDSSWQQVSRSLAAYAGQPILIRFRYRNINGSYLIGTTGYSNNDGMFFDDISVSNVQELGASTTWQVGGAATSFTFTPGAAGKTYYLQMRPFFGDCGDFGFGDPLAVTSAAGPSGTLELVGASLEGGYVYVDFKVTSGSFSSFTLRQSSTFSGWSNSPGATLINQGGGNYRFRATPSGDRLFYVVIAQ
ncbi:MAG: CAP domain-containing protein [Verrucomicrobiales bacterium]